MTLAPFFSARHIVVIGASSDPGRVGGRPIAYLRRLGFEGRISPVNPNRPEIQGLPSYPDVASVPDDPQPDLALVAVAGEAAVAAVAACGARGIRAAVVFSAGFGEVGDEGRAAEARLVAAAREHGVRLCGPNTLGIISAPARVTATFATSLDATERLEPGDVGIISQSGALGAFMHRQAQLDRLGLRHFVATGNEADLTAGDYLREMVADEEIRAVGVYLEGVRDGRSLMEGLEHARALGKPVGVVKVGRAERAAAAARSHTGALAGDDAAMDAALERHGAIRVDDIDDLLALLSLVSGLDALPKGSGLAVVTLSGGLGVWSADVAEDRGVHLADLSESTRDQLAALLPGFASVANPVDVTGQIVNEPDLMGRSIELVAADPAVDAVFVGLGIQEALGETIAAGIVAAAARATKPVVVGWMAGPEAAYVALEAGGIPTFRSIGRGLTALTNLLRWAGTGARAPQGISAGGPEVSALVAALPAEPTEHEAKQILAAVGVPTPRGELIASADDAVAALARLGGPVAMKAQIPGVAHKSDFGLVELGVEEAAGATAAFERIRANAERHGVVDAGGRLEVLIEAMSSSSVELILGYRRDPVFGPMITLGLGGIYAEVLRSVASRLVPLDREEVLLLLERSNVAKVLGTYRGKAATDLEPLVDAVLRFAAFVDAHQDTLAEVEINPLALSRPSGAVSALDALIIRNS